MSRKRALLLASLWTGMLAGGSTASLAFLTRYPHGFLDVLGAGSLLGGILGGAAWLVLDHQETRRGWALHPVTGALWALAVATPPTWFLALCGGAWG